MKISLLSTLFVLLFSFGLMAQGTVSGNVTDGNEPLIGVSISVMNSSQGTITDLDGNYSISLAAGTHTLVASYVGYTDSEQTVDCN